MTPEPRTRARRRKTSTTAGNAAETTMPIEETVITEQPPESDPNIIDTTAVVISEAVEPLMPVSSPEPESPRTDFFFPPPPRAEQQAESRRASTRSARQRASQAPRGAGRQTATRQTRRILKGLGRTIQILVVFLGTSIKRATFPTLRRIWRWLTVDPYAPPREQPNRSILQGHVLGVYRYQLYQRIILGILGGVPLTIAALYLLYTIVNSLLYGIDGWLFLAQDLAAACAGIFGGLMMLSLGKTRITLRGDGIEYKTMFRVVRSRWEEVSMLKVDYFRHSERWIVGTGRGAWAFLYRSLFGMPHGRQLAKLITVYARLVSTGTPYWLPSLGRFAENTSDDEESAAETTEEPAGAPQPAS